MVVEACLVHVAEDTGKAEEEDAEEDVDDVAEGEAKHQLVEVPLDDLAREPQDSGEVSNHSKNTNKHLKKKLHNHCQLLDNN